MCQYSNMYYNLQGLVPSTLDALPHLMLMIILWDRSFYPHFTDVKAEGWRLTNAAIIAK